MNDKDKKIDIVDNLLDDDKIEILDEDISENNKTEVPKTNNEDLNVDEKTLKTVIPEIPQTNTEKSDNTENMVNIEDNITTKPVTTPQVSTENNEIVDNAKDMGSTSTSNNNNPIEIKETTTLKSEAGTKVIGEVNGDNVTITAQELPKSIDISVKPPKVETIGPKKVKIVTKRQKTAKILVTLLVILILAGGGYAAYYFLYAQNNNLFEAKNVTVEAGTTLPTSASYYVKTSKTIDDMEYTIDLSGVASSIGTYNYTINHNGVIKMGTVTIKDSKGPEVIFKDNLQFNKGSAITKDDLVKECNDISNCTFELATSVNTSVAGDVEITINAKDDVGNVTNATATIKIIDISKVLVCTSAAEKASDGTYTTKLVDSLSFDSSNNLVSSTGKKVYTYIDYSSYFEIYNAQQNNKEYNFDKKTFSYWQSNDVLVSNLKTFDEINTFYTSNNYSCE